MIPCRVAAGRQVPIRRHFAIGRLFRTNPGPRTFGRLAWIVTIGIGERPWLPIAHADPPRSHHDPAALRTAVPIDRGSL